MSVSQKIDGLEAKIKLLVEKYELTKEEFEIVKREKQDLERQLLAFQKQGVQPTQAALFEELPSQEKQGLKEKLDQYIEEVDECIDLVNKL